MLLECWEQISGIRLVLTFSLSIADTCYTVPTCIEYITCVKLEKIAMLTVWIQIQFDTFKMNYRMTWGILIQQKDSPQCSVPFDFRKCASFWCCYCLIMSNWPEARITKNGFCRLRLSWAPGPIEPLTQLSPGPIEPHPNWAPAQLSPAPIEPQPNWAPAQLSPRPNWAPAPIEPHPNWAPMGNFVFGEF